MISNIIRNWSHRYPVSSGFHDKQIASNTEVILRGIFSMESEMHCATIIMLCCVGVLPDLECLHNDFAWLVVLSACLNSVVNLHVQFARVVFAFTTLKYSLDNSACVEQTLVGAKWNDGRKAHPHLR